MATKHDRTPAGVGVGDGARTRDNQIHSLGLYQLSYAHHVSSIAVPSRGTRPGTPRPAGRVGAPEGTRTPDLLLRRQLLYPPELQARGLTSLSPGPQGRGSPAGTRRESPAKRRTVAPPPRGCKGRGVRAPRRKCAAGRGRGRGAAGRGRRESARVEAPWQRAKGLLRQRAGSNARLPTEKGVECPRTRLRQPGNSRMCCDSRPEGPLLARSPSGAAPSEAPRRLVPQGVDAPDPLLCSRMGIRCASLSAVSPPGTRHHPPRQPNGRAGPRSFAPYRRMLHACPRAARGTLLFRDWIEARALWDRLTAGLRFRALVLMPDHVHVQLMDASQLAPLAVALRSYARWRNGTRGESGTVWEHRSSPTPIRGRRARRAHDALHPPEPVPTRPRRRSSRLAVLDASRRRRARPAPRASPVSQPRAVSRVGLRRSIGRPARHAVTPCAKHGAVALLAATDLRGRQRADTDPRAGDARTAVRRAAFWSAPPPGWQRSRTSPLRSSRESTDRRLAGPRGAVTRAWRSWSG